MEIFGFQQRSKKTHGIFWIISRDPKKHMDFCGFSAEIQKNTWNFLDFQQRSKKTHGIFSGFSAEIQKNTWNFFRIFSRNPKKHMEFFPDFQQKSKLKLQTLRESRSCNFHGNLSASFRRLKFQSRMGSKIQDPRLSRGLLAESWIPIETD